MKLGKMPCLRHMIRENRVWLVEVVILEMLWNLGAFVTCMGEGYWKKVGRSRPVKSLIGLCVVFQKPEEKPLGRAKMNAKWND